MSRLLLVGEVTGEGVPDVAWKGARDAGAASDVWQGDCKCQPWKRLYKESKEALSSPSLGRTLRLSSCLPFSKMMASSRLSGGEGTAGWKRGLVSRLLNFSPYLITVQFSAEGWGRAGRWGAASDSFLENREGKVSLIGVEEISSGGNLSQEAATSLKKRERFQNKEPNYQKCCILSLPLLEGSLFSSAVWSHLTGLHSDKLFLHGKGGLLLSG